MTALISMRDTFWIEIKCLYIADPNKVVHTELTLESEEFDLYEVDQETKITFCLKELKVRCNFLASYIYFSIKLWYN